jgi:hypothetical protein
MFRLLKVHADKVVLLPLLGAVIAGIISLSVRATIFPDGRSLTAAADHAAPLSPSPSAYLLGE